MALIKHGEYPFIDIIEELFLGSCESCGYDEARSPEELEPGSPCPRCKKNTFGGLEDTYAGADSD